ncbi:MAG TPA: GNAT family N-acetyltransferase [Clostridia bacterium]|nr:GNAT family N-acetyltransferase [Clostridia bacterium]
MVQIEPERYETLLLQLNGIPFNTLFARSVLEGHARGEVLADCETEPQLLYIVHQYGMSLLLGESGNGAFNEALHERFSHVKKEEYLQAFPSTWHEALAPLVKSGAVKQYTRVNFAFDANAYAHERERRGKLEYRAIPTPPELLEGIKGRVVPSGFWRDTKTLRALCVSFSVLCEGNVASTSFAAYRHGNLLELGIETAEAHRGKGLAYAACCALIDFCIEKGFDPVWSCRLDNEGSMMLAKRLGFIETVRTPYYHIPAQAG